MKKAYPKIKFVLPTALLLLFFLNQQATAQQQHLKKKVMPPSGTVKKPTTTQQKTATQQKQRVVEIITDYGSILVALYNETPLHRDNFIKLVKEGFYDSLLFHRVIKDFMIQGGDPLSKYADTAAQLGMGDNGYKIEPEIRRKYLHRRGVLAAARDNNPEKKSSGCQFYIVQGKKYTLKELENIMNAKNLQRKQEIFYNYAQVDSVNAKLTQLQTAGDKEALRKYFDEMLEVVNVIYQNANPLIYTPEEVEMYIKEGGAPHLDGDYTVFGEVIIGLDVLDTIANLPTKQGDRPIKDVRMKMRILQ